MLPNTDILTRTLLAPPRFQFIDKTCIVGKILGQLKINKILGQLKINKQIHRVFSFVCDCFINTYSLPIFLLSCGPSFSHTERSGKFTLVLNSERVTKASMMFEKEILQLLG